MQHDAHFDQPEAVSENTERVPFSNSGHHKYVFHRNSGMKLGSHERVGCNTLKKKIILCLSTLLT